jgi:adenylate cyclase
MDASEEILYPLGGFFVCGGNSMTTEDFKRKLSAVFSADVVGYSRMMGENEAETVKTLEIYKGIMFTLIKQHRGRVVDSPGDNLLAEFGSVVDAVQCAVAVQKELQARNSELPEERKMLFRIGINLGDVIEEKERLYGDGVNIAARLEALADPGGICVSKTAFDQIETKLPVGYEYLGEKEVKNISKPVGAFRVLMDEEAAGKVIGDLRPKTRQLRGVAIGAIAVLILVAAALVIWNSYFRPDFEPATKEKMAYPLPDKPSIAVLPFDNMSGDPEQDYLADGISENIIDALSRSSRLFVIARNSTFTYKGKPVKIQQVSEELGVRYVLEGSLQKSGSRLRVTAQLIDAIKGNHLWSEKYDRKLENIFEVQDELTKEIITALNVELTQGEQARLAAKGTDNLEAYLKFIQARENVYRHTIESNALAQQLAQEALTLDPKYASASRILGITHMHDILLGRSKSPKESLGKAIALVKKAIKLDDQNGYSHASLGFLLVMIRQYDQAVAEAERGIDLDPNVADIYGWSGIIYRYVGRWKDAVTAYEKAIRLNPIPPDFYLQGLGLAYAWTGRYEEGIRVLKKAVQNAPDSPYGHLFAAAAYSMAGREEDARREADEVLRLNPKFSLEKWGKSLKYKNQDDQERLMSALRKAGLPDKPPLPLPDKPSIAVLPFVNMSGDPEQEYFSDGITEEIITALSKVPKIFVIARHSSFTYKGKPIWVPTVGKELGVRYVLEGSVRKAGNKVRITAQLVDAQSGNHLWAERYDRDLKDIFAIQDEITMKIITALQVKLTEGEQASLDAKGTDNLDAYLMFLQGIEHFRRLNKEDMAIARKMCEEAIALDPEWPTPYLLLGWIYWNNVFLGWSKSPRESIKRALAAAQKCIALDDSYSSAHGLMSAVYTMKRHHDKAILEAEKAVALDPNSADDHARLGNVFNFAGKPEEAILALERAIRLNPFPPSWYLHMLGMAFRETGRYEESITVCKKALQRQPTNIYAHLVLASTYSLLNRQEEARAEAAEVLRISPKFSLGYLAKSRPHIDPANTERFVESLRKAGLK